MTSVLYLAGAFIAGYLYRRYSEKRRIKYEVKSAKMVDETKKYLPYYEEGDPW